MKKSKDIKAFNILSYTVVTLIALFCFIPFLIVVMGSITDEKEIIANGFSLLPSKLSLSAYGTALKEPMAILRAYGITISLTIIGTACGLFIVAMTAYVLQRKDFKWRNKFSFYFYFTTLFNGGLVPWYILMVKYLGLKDTYLSLLIPPMLSVFNIILMKSYIGGIPQALTESAKIDGASETRIFFQICLPLALPGIATISLFTALAYWNDWFNALLYIKNPDFYPLQYLLMQIQSNMDYIAKSAGLSSQVVGAASGLPKETGRMAMVVVATLPIAMLYPFFQRYFVKGLTIGGVKE